MTALETRILPIGQLKPAPYNPRRPLDPDSPAYRKLAASLSQFGLVEPLIWNELSGHVVGGHARLQILKEMGHTEAPVSVVCLSEAREKALNVVLNNREAQGRFDAAKLADLLGELQELPELTMTGFELADLKALRLQPLRDLAPLETSDQVEITLMTDAATFERLSEALDKLIGDFDLACHIRRR